MDARFARNDALESLQKPLIFLYTPQQITPRPDTAGFCISERTPTMATKPGTNPKGEFVFFDVVYEDGSQRSNRRVPAELLGGLEKDEPALGFLIEQDREIAEKSGRAPLKIVSARRVGAKPEKMMKVK